MRILLLGLPGCGKGAQGNKLAETLNIPHISIGDCVRKILTTNSYLADEIRAFHSGKWKPLPDELAAKIFYEFATPNCIIDGFPRNVQQLKQFNRQPDDRFILLKISEQESLKRVINRKRSDDALDFWQSRIEVEKERLPELIEAINPIVINAEKSIELVFEEILNVSF